MDQKAELVRIMIDALNSLGYKRKRMFLEMESGIILHTERVQLFVTQIIEGEWDESLSTLSSIRFTDEKFAELASMTILQHKLSELLYKEKFTEALITLRNRIAPLCKNDEVLVHEYCVSFVTPSMNVVNGPHSYGEKALEDLRSILPLEGRLVDHRVGRENIPSRTVQILREHKDEVWCLQFSHNGKYLASSSKDGLVILWQVTEATKEVCKIRVLRGHNKPVSHISWSPDDSQLLTWGLGEAVTRWSISSGKPLTKSTIWRSGTTSCAWAPDGNAIYVGIVEYMSVIKWDLEGRVLHRWSGQTTGRMADLAVTLGGMLIATCNANKILLFGDTSRFIEEEDGDILSFSLSEDGNFLLVSMSNEELHLWDIGIEIPVIVMRFRGHTSRGFVMRSCFGGQTYIAGGSEDSQVYIWDRVSGEMIRKLEGHSSVVNCVSSNPAIPRMLASGSDDHTIRIWG